AGAKAGPLLIRAWNDAGASAPIALLVEEVAQTAEVEPNDDFRSPQVLSGSRVAVNGNHAKNGDVDTFAMDLKAGQEWVVWVDAYVLAAGFDAMLRITDLSGRVLAFNHDGPRNMDPFLVFKVPSDGRYLVQTMGHKYPASTELEFAGGADCVYRLHLCTEPLVRNTWPLAVQRGVKTRINVEGWNLGAGPQEVEVEGRDGEKTREGFPITLSDVPEFLETPEEAAAAVVREVPFGVSGRMGLDGAERTSRFRGVKDSKITFRVESARWGSELDGWLKIRTLDGKELAANDDGVAGSNEPELTWTVPADGEYVVAVGDLTRRGGGEFFYHLGATPAGAGIPKVSATVAQHSVIIEAGKPGELKATIKFQGGPPADAAAGAEKPVHEIVARELPDGIVMPPVEVPEKGGEVTVVFNASPTKAEAGKDAAAKAGAVSGPFRLVVRNRNGGEEFPVKYQMISIGENNGVPTGYRELLIPGTDWLWVTALPAAEAAAEAKK
ncbi:MAG: putative subtilase-type serine protease precursor, partial [Verrucomicrobiales bacterium]|nr:putative subtilase-type serine protease precursor [Verrucomicrobiales bacterium]